MWTACINTINTQRGSKRHQRESLYERKTAYFGTWLEHLSFGISFTFRRAKLPASPLKGHKYSPWMRMILQGVVLGTVPGLVACGQQRGAPILAGFLSDASGFPLLRAWISFVEIRLAWVPHCWLKPCDLQYLQYLSTSPPSIMHPSRYTGLLVDLFILGLYQRYWIF